MGQITPFEWSHPYTVSLAIGEGHTSIQIRDEIWVKHPDVIEGDEE